MCRVSRSQDTQYTTELYLNFPSFIAFFSFLLVQFLNFPLSVVAILGISTLLAASGVPLLFHLLSWLNSLFHIHIFFIRLKETQKWQFQEQFTIHLRSTSILFISLRYHHISLRFQVLLPSIRWLLGFGALWGLICILVFASKMPRNSIFFLSSSDLPQGAFFLLETKIVGVAQGPSLHLFSCYSLP